VAVGHTHLREDDAAHLEELAGELRVRVRVARAGVELLFGASLAAVPQPAHQLLARLRRRRHAGFGAQPREDIPYRSARVRQCPADVEEDGPYRFHACCVPLENGLATPTQDTGCASEHAAHREKAGSMIVLKALALGIVEGVTEFLPISSTGHLIVASAVIDYPETSRETFEIFIQLGAILAVVWHFRGHLLGLLTRAPSDATARAMIGKVLLAFVPAAVAGFLFHRAIEHHLFSPMVVAGSLIAGGVVIIAVERRSWCFRVGTFEAVGWAQAWWVGVAQVLSLIPGVSRAGATIIGGMFAGLDRPVSTQFSFYLSIPTMFAASLYSLFKARHLLAAADALPLAAGFAAAFVSALLVVRAFVTFVQRHDFTGFGYYRIVAGLLIFALFR
jgi:undecaprenyl-diphosphatase